MEGTVDPRHVTESTIFSGIVTKHWLIPFDEEKKRTHVVSLRHSPLDGFRYVLIDETEIEGSQGVYRYSLQNWFSGQMQAPDVITLDFKEGPKVTLQIVQTSKKFMYACSTDGSPVQELTRSTVCSTTDCHDYVSPFIITLSEYEIVPNESEIDDRVVWYTMYVVEKSSGKLAVCRRRFRHFYELNCDIISAFASSHLQSMLPKFPDRHFKWFTDHYSRDFVENRRTELEVYMQRLVRVPRAAQNPSFKNFINFLTHPKVSLTMVSSSGISSVEIRPRSPTMHVKLRAGEFVHVCARGALGIVLRCERPGDINADVFISRISESVEFEDGRTKLKVGDRLSRLNGVDVVGKMKYKELISKIRSFRARHGMFLPLVLHFIRNEEKKTQRGK